MSLGRDEWVSFSFKCHWSLFSVILLAITHAKRAILWAKALRWRHNGRDGVSNHQPYDCLLNSLFGCRKFRVTGLRGGVHRGPGNSPHKWSVTRKMFPFEDVIMKDEEGHSPNYKNLSQWIKVHRLKCTLWKHPSHTCLTGVIAICYLTWMFLSLVVL